MTTYRYDNRIFNTLEEIADDVVANHGTAPFEILWRDPPNRDTPIEVFVEWPEPRKPKQLAQMLLPEVRAWWSEHHLPVTDDDLLSDLEAAVRNTEDGYDRAHWLHHYRGWWPSAKLVAILNNQRQ